MEKRLPRAAFAFIHNRVFGTDALFIRTENTVGARSAQWQCLVQIDTWGTVFGPAMNETALREEICDLGRSIYERGLTHGSTGNISARCDGGWLLTPTGSNLGRLDPARLSKLDWQGNLVSGDRPSKENFLHLAMYQERERNQAVIHLHATHSVAVSVLEEVDPAEVLPPLTAYYVMRIGSLPLVPYYAPGDMQLAQAVRGFAGKHHAMLLANHGPVVAGTSLAAAADAVEELEATARLYLLLHGRRVRALTPQQVADIRHRYPAA